MEDAPSVLGPGVAGNDIHNCGPIPDNIPD